MSDVERLSWRDPDGFVVSAGDRILRAVVLERAEQIRELIREPWMTRLTADGLLPRTVEVSNPPPLLEGMDRWLWLEHEALPLPCYPHEITALQLYDSGQLTLKIALNAAQHGWMLKDASAWNVLHSQGRAVFVDFLSFEKSESTGTWIAYGQFVRHFILPLLLYRKLRITPPELFLNNRDGVTPEGAYQFLGATRFMSAAALEFVVLPKLLAGAGSRMIANESRRTPRVLDTAFSTAAILRTLQRLQRSLERLRPDKLKSKSVWKGYEEERTHYTDADLVAKTEFVRRSVQDSRRVLDLGCNAGEFSLLAAEGGKTVVAADADHPALSRLYSRIRGKGTLITPLLVNIARPTPAIGWKNREIASFIDRSSGGYDCVLMLGLIHHLIVSERATIPMLADLVDELDPKRVVIEWVDPEDPKFRQLAGLNQKLYSQLNIDQFEDCFRQKFRLLSKSVLPCTTRTMYLWCR